MPPNVLRRSWTRSARDKVELILGIDAATVETYKTIKKMNYNEKVWKVVAEYCAAKRPNAVNKVWAKFIFCLENYHEAEHFVRRAATAGVKHVYYDFDLTRARSHDLRKGIGLPEEVTDHVAVLRHECARRGIETAFAESGLAWLTPERTDRIEHQLERLRYHGGVSRAEPHAPDVATGSARHRQPAEASPTRKASLKMALMAAQAGLIWLTPEGTESIGRELKQLNQAEMSAVGG